MRCKTRLLLRFCGFFEAVADGAAKAFIVGEWAEDYGNSVAVEFTETGEEGLGQRFVVVEGLPAKDFDVVVVNGPVLREHDADFFFVGEELGEAVVEFGFGFDEDEGGVGGVVADAYAGGG